MKTGLGNAVTVFIDSNGQPGTLNSSARFKEDIRDMVDYSRGIFDLRPVTYHYKEPAADVVKPLESGLSAEEVAKVYPDLVAYGSDGRLETVEYHKLTPMLLNELQRQQRTLNGQAQQIADLRMHTKHLEGSLAEIKAENQRLQTALAEQNAGLGARLAKPEMAGRNGAAMAIRQAAAKELGTGAIGSIFILDRFLPNLLRGCVQATVSAIEMAPQARLELYKKISRSYKSGGAAVFGLVRFWASIGQKCFT